jgi:hypothetical protein
MSNGFALPPLSHLKWLAIDLDGTLAEPLWTSDNPTNLIGDPIRINVIKLREAVRAGYKVVVHTSRPWTDYASIEAWLTLYDIPFRDIQCGKILAELYIDDRGRHASASSWIPDAGSRIHSPRETA